MNGPGDDRKLAAWRERLHEIIFEADTPAGKAFDVALLVSIILSVVAVLLESVAEIRERYGLVLRTAEWIFTAMFTVEYVLRLISVLRRIRAALVTMVRNHTRTLSAGRSRGRCVNALMYACCTTSSASAAFPTSENAKPNSNPAYRSTSS